MSNNKMDYIFHRYIANNNSPNCRLIYANHIQKRKRIAQPFASFYPDPEYIYKKTAKHK